MTPFTLHPTRPEDREAVGTLLLKVWDGDEGAVAYHGGGRAPGVMANLGDEVVGYASLRNGTRHPTSGYVGVHVHPAHRRQGVGAALWHQVTRGVTGAMKTATYAHLPEAVRFLGARGLTVRLETHLPTLDPARVSAAQVSAWVREAEALGFALLPMPALEGPDLRRRLTRLHLDVYAHTHEHDPPAAESEQEAGADFLGDDLRPEWLWVARRGDELAGVSSVRDMGDPAAAELGWFGVPGQFAAYGRILTLALTGLALRSAAASGVTRVLPELDSADPNAMHLRRELPWEPGRVWLTLTGDVRD